VEYSPVEGPPGNHALEKCRDSKGFRKVQQDFS